MKDLRCYIATVEITMHHLFPFLDAEFLPDSMLVNVALDALAGSFKRKPKEGRQEVLGSLVALGLARETDSGRYLA